MLIWTCEDHDGHWPVPVASVVVAPSEEAARALLDAELVSRHLKPSAKQPYTLTLLDPAEAGVRMLSDGEY